MRERQRGGAGVMGCWGLPSILSCRWPVGQLWATTSLWICWAVVQDLMLVHMGPGITTGLKRVASWKCPEYHHWLHCSHWPTAASSWREEIDGKEPWAPCIWLKGPLNTSEPFLRPSESRDLPAVVRQIIDIELYVILWAGYLSLIDLPSCVFCFLIWCHNHRVKIKWGIGRTLNEQRPLKLCL